MARIALALVVVVLTVAIQDYRHAHGSPGSGGSGGLWTFATPHSITRKGNSAPQATYDQIVNAAKSGNWEQFQAYLNANLGNQPNWKPVDFDSIRDLKPVGGGQVYGEAEYKFESVSNINGAQTAESGGHKIINDNGHVNEFDLKP